jgi:hypothetical protein
MTNFASLTAGIERRKGALPRFGHANRLSTQGKGEGVAGTAQFKIDADAYVAASRAAYRAQLRGGALWGRLLLFVLGFSAVAIVTVGLLYGNWIWAVRVGLQSGAVGFAAGVVGYGIIYLLLPARVRPLYLQQRALHGEQRIEWDDDGLAWRGPTFTMDTPWQDYHRWHESAGEFLLYVNAQMPQFLPKAQLLPEQAADLRATLVAYGPPRR